MKRDWEYRPVTWQSEIDDDWTVTYYGMRSPLTRNIVIAALEITPSGTIVPSAGVTAELLRGVKLGTARRLLVALKQLQESVESSRRLDEFVSLKAAKKAPLQAKKLRQYLREYQELCRAEDPGPAKTLAARHRVNRSTMRTWIRRAKQL